MITHKFTANSMVGPHLPSVTYIIDDGVLYFEEENGKRFFIEDKGKPVSFFLTKRAKYRKLGLIVSEH